jgi:hypothetical protein
LVMQLHIPTTYVLYDSVHSGHKTSDKRSEPRLLSQNLGAISHLVATKSPSSSTGARLFLFDSSKKHSTRH